MQKRRQLLLRLLILLLLSVLKTSYAQQSSLLIDRLTVDDGLSQSDVKCLVQDSLGFLWIGTRDGLNRFDGYRFEKFHFDNKDSTSLGFNQIFSINVLPGGNIIVGSIGGFSIYEYGHQHFQNHYFDQSNTNAIVNDVTASQGKIILATTGGILSFDPASGIYTRDDDPSLKDQVLTQIKLSPSGAEWLGSTTGLYFRRSKKEPLKNILSQKYVFHINFDRGNVLVSTAQGLFEFTGEGELKRQITLLPDFPTAVYTLRARNGELWLAGHQVLVLSEDASQILHVLGHDKNNRRTLTEDRVRVLYETRDGTIWLGTMGYGLNKHNPSTRSIYGLSEASTPKLSSNYVSAIYTDDDTVVYVGTSRGVNIVNRSQNTVTVINPPKKNKGDALFLVYVIRKDKSGNLWMTGSGGLYLWKNGSFVLQTDRSGEIFDFAEFDPETLLLVTRAEGCFKFNKRTREVSTFLEPSKPSADRTTLLVDEETIWVGALDGLRSYDRYGKLLEHFTANAADSTALSSNAVKGLFIDSNQNFWIGTWGGGLIRFDRTKKEFETFTTRDGLPSNVIYGLIEDNQGNLWMGTNSGLTAFDPKKSVFRNFDVMDGLQSDEFNTGAYFRSQKGVAYFGGVGGMNSFRPEKILTGKNVTNVILTDIDDHSTDLKDLYETGVIQMDWHDEDLTLHFASVDFGEARKYVFEYSINNDTWRNLGSSRRLDLSRMAAGEYEISIRSSTDGASWSEGNVVAKIVVKAPLWQRPSSYVVLIIFLMLIAFLIHRIRLSTLRGLNEKLNKLVLERTREVREKSDEIVAQNEELMSQTDELSTKNLLLEQTKSELVTFQAELEQRVNERTNDIQTLNRELLYQNVQLEQFSFITAHNFRGPVARIKGLIELLSREPISQEEFSQIRSYLKVSISDLDEVITDLNAILHIKGKLKDSFEPVNVQPIMKKVLSELEHEIRRTGMKVDTSAFGDHALLGIDAFFHSVFYNLTENALKYRRHDAKPTLIISCMQKNDNIEIEFDDNGVGIDMQLAMPKIFRLYQRFTYSGEGRGLGLYLVKTQTEMMDGEITVESTLGIGTRFKLVFPTVR